MTPKQERFVQEYVKDLNATQAAIRAGYAEKAAAVEGSRLLRNAQVEAAIAKALMDRAAKSELTAQRVLEGLLREASGDGPDTNTSGRVNAWKLLGQYLRMFTERHEHTGKDGKPIQVEAISDEARRDFLISLREAMKDVPGANQALAAFLRARIEEKKSG